MTLRVGDAVPDFTLRDQHGRRRSLAQWRDERSVVLVFFPFAFSGVCTGELRELREQSGRIAEAGGELLAVSCDPMFALRVFADQDGLEFPLLSDYWPHGEVARAYGVFEEQGGFAARGTFLIDTDGIVRWTLVNSVGEARDFSGYHAALKTLVEA